MQPPSLPPVSAVLITFNAARLLAAVLESVRWCDEIVVVDSGSTDQTLTIAQQYGCRIMHRDFDGFGPQKQFAVSLARNHWVLALDADEIITPELGREIQQKVGEAVAGKDASRAFTVPRTLIFLGRLMRYGGEHKQPQLRLFDKRYGNYNAAPVHETIEINGPVGRLTHEMLHDSYASLHDYFGKFNQYTTAGAEAMASRGKKGTKGAVILRFPLTFLKEYFLKLNVLNGYPGFVWSLFSALYPVAKYAKLREIQQSHRL